MSSRDERSRSLELRASYDSVCPAGGDTFGTDTLNDGLVLDSTAAPARLTSMSPSTVVGALVVAILKIVMTIRFQGELS